PPGRPGTHRGSPGWVLRGDLGPSVGHRSPGPPGVPPGLTEVGPLGRPGVRRASPGSNGAPGDPSGVTGVGPPGRPGVHRGS
ncbi:collagen alpha-1(III) chain-like, partial [Cygnus atratus]|uniref:collagen alpha-1(III) chain-like n=1 Tax=Cygnus atratus TaxID=8868 RepID=UPI0021B70917